MVPGRLDRGLPRPARAGGRATAPQQSPQPGDDLLRARLVALVNERHPLEEALEDLVTQVKDLDVEKAVAEQQG